MLEIDCFRFCPGAVIPDSYQEAPKKGSSKRSPGPTVFRPHAAFREGSLARGYRADRRAWARPNCRRVAKLCPTINGTAHTARAFERKEAALPARAKSP